MNDLHTLNEAFGELERRADEQATRVVPAPGSRSHRRLLVAATVVAVCALAAGTAVLATRGTDDATGQAGGTLTRHSTSGHGSAAQHKLAEQRHERQLARERAAKRQLARERAAREARRRHQLHNQDAGGLQVPQDTNELQTEFANVLGNMATVTVTVRDMGGSGNGRDVFIGGIMTAADGSKGGYDVQILQADPGSKAMCDDPGTMTCEKSNLPDGSSLAVGHEPLTSGATLHEADLITSSGVELVLHVSNQADPKGAGQVFGPNPPLTMDQVQAVATSTNW